MPLDLSDHRYHSVTHTFKERNLRKLEKMARQAASAEPTQHAPISLRERAPQMRSEEHTSELQSP